jgi:hypothetical protein
VCGGWIALVPSTLRRNSLAGSSPPLEDQLKYWGVLDDGLRKAVLQAVRERLLSSVEVVEAAQQAGEPTECLRALVVRAQLRRENRPKTVGSLHVDTSGKMYVCVDSTEGAPIWRRIDDGMLPEP